VQLTNKDLPTTRLRLLNEQGQLCALCHQTITGRAVVDHDHKSGLIRGVLHSQCNWMLGKIEAAQRRSGQKDFARLSAEYLELEPTSLLYPKKAKRRKRKKRAK